MWIIVVIIQNLKTFEFAKKMMNNFSTHPQHNNRNHIFT